MLATLDDLRRNLGLGDEDRSEDNLLMHLCAIAEGLIEKHCKRKFASLEITEYLDGENTPELLLSRYPVTKIHSVWIDSSRNFGPETRLHSAEFGIYPATGVLKRTSGLFPRKVDNVKVVYTAGYETPPDDLALACVQLAAQLYLVSDLSAETEALVAPYRNREPK